MTTRDRLYEAQQAAQQRREEREAALMRGEAPKVDESTQRLVDRVLASTSTAPFRDPSAPLPPESSRILAARAMGRPYPEPEPEPTTYRIRGPVSPYSAPEPDLGGGDDDL